MCLPACLSDPGDIPEPEIKGEGRGEDRARHLARPIATSTMVGVGGKQISGERELGECS
jgi:hypothetical protein